MRGLAPGIMVNDIHISPDEINEEVQYHPAESLYDAKYNAMKALVIKEILLQRAVELGLYEREENVVTKPDEVIDNLLAQELDVPQADDETCLRYYNNNKEKFFTSPIFEVSHILYLAPPNDEKVREEAKSQAKQAIQKLKENPNLFISLAERESACPSSREKGHLGQVSRGQTMPAFEVALFKMKQGDLSQEPVATEVGYHVIKVHEHAEGIQLPFDKVSDWIKNTLEQKSWDKAFNQYVQLLAGRAKISGFRFGGMKSPLVQ